MPGAQCTRSLVCAWCSEYAHEYSQRGHRNRPAFPHAMVLTVYFELSPAIGCFATVASRIKVLSGPVGPNEPPQDLTPASRRQDHTISPSASAPSSCVPEFAHGEQSALRFACTPDAACVHRISSRVRDDRDTPLVWDETVADMLVIWVDKKRKYFSLWEWTGPATPNLARRAVAFMFRMVTIERRPLWCAGRTEVGYRATSKKSDHLYGNIPPWRPEFVVHRARCAEMADYFGASGPTNFRPLGPVPLT